MQCTVTTFPVKKQTSKARRLCWFANIKIILPLEMARAHAEAILNPLPSCKAQESKIFLFRRDRRAVHLFRQHNAADGPFGISHNGCPAFFRVLCTFPCWHSGLKFLYFSQQQFSDGECPYDESLLFCILLLLYYDCVVRLICGAKISSVRDCFVRHRLDLCRIFIFPKHL